MASSKHPADRIDGASLLLTDEPAERANRYWFWIGALPTLPFAHLDLVGIHFPKEARIICRRVQKTPNEIAPQENIDIKGHVVGLSVADLERLAAALPSRAIRFRGVTSQGDPRAVVIRRPAAAELAAYEAQGLPRPAYRRDPDDRAVAEFIYVQHVPSWCIRGIDAELPAPLSETGLELPQADWEPINPNVPARPPEGLVFAF